MSGEDIAQWALRFASQGFHVFPLLERFVSAKNKIGTPRGWAHNRQEDPNSIPSTLDLGEISRWSSKYPDLKGYGIHPRNRAAIIFDIDVKNDKAGLESLDAFLKQKLLTLSTLIVKTKSGGLHLYYSCSTIPTKYLVKNQTAFREGIDIRGEGGFVVGPTTDGPYLVKKDAPIAALPDEMVTILTNENCFKVINKDIEELIIEGTDESVIPEPGDSLYYGVIPDRIVMGERDDVITRLIGAWVKKFNGDRHMVIELCKLAISKMDQTPGDEYTLEMAVEKIDRTVQSKNFMPSANDKVMEYLHENLIFLSNSGAIFDRSDKNYPRIFRKPIALDFYKPLKLKINDGNKVKTVSAFDMWLQSKDRLELNSYGYRPNGGSIYFCPIQSCDIANLYRPPVLPPDANYKDYQPYIDKFRWLMDYLWGEDSEHIIDWCAHLVQKPDQKLRFAPFLWSDERGVGKNLFFDIMSNVIGKWNAIATTVDKVVSKHASYELRCHLLLVNETYVDTRNRSGVYQRRDVMEKLKPKISDDVQEVEEKYMPSISVQSFINYIGFSNHEDGLPVEDKDRRFEIYRCDGKPLGPKDYELITEMGENPGQDGTNYNAVAALRKWLFERDISKLLVTARAKDSDVKMDMIMAGKDPTVVEIEMAIRNYQSVFRSDVISFELFSWFINNKIEDGNKIHRNIKYDWFKKLTKRISYVPPSGNVQAKMIFVDTPMDVTKENLAPEKKQCRIFTVRNHGDYDRFSTDELKARYELAFDATKPTYKEPENVVVKMVK